MDNKKALVFDIYRGTTHDGPGIRSTVFFKGCPLHCRWCHNPEGISPKQQIWKDRKRCIGCGLCKGGIENCPTKALQMVAKEYDVETLLQELLKDDICFRQSGGGVTASGGEAMMQYPFVANLFECLHQIGISTALDTCGYTSMRAFEKVLPYTDYILYDLKLFSNQEHLFYTGRENILIFKNLKAIMEGKCSGKWKTKIWIRTPLIPEATVVEDNIKSLANYLKPFLGKEIEGWELCAFNNICVNKYEKLGIEWLYKNTDICTQEMVDGVYKIMDEVGLNKEQIVVSGIIK